MFRERLSSIFILLLTSIYFDSEKNLNCTYILFYFICFILTCISLLTRTRKLHKALIYFYFTLVFNYCVSHAAPNEKHEDPFYSVL